MTKQDVVENAKCDLKTFFNCTYSFLTFDYGFGSGFSVADPDFLADPDPEKRLIRTKGPGSETLKKDLNNFDNLSPLQLANVQTVHIKSPG